MHDNKFRLKCSFITKFILFIVFNNVDKHHKYIYYTWAMHQISGTLSLPDESQIFYCETSPDLWEISGTIWQKILVFFSVYCNPHDTDQTLFHNQMIIRSCLLETIQSIPLHQLLVYNHNYKQRDYQTSLHLF